MKPGNFRDLDRSNRKCLYIFRIPEEKLLQVLCGKLTIALPAYLKDPEPILISVDNHFETKSLNLCVWHPWFALVPEGEAVPWTVAELVEKYQRQPSGATEEEIRQKRETFYTAKGFREELISALQTEIRRVISSWSS